MLLKDEQYFKSAIFLANSSPQKLRYAKTPAITNAQCKQSWPPSYISDDMICEGSSSKGGCMGDSGGPFVCNEDGKAIVAGVVSWGSSTCKVHVPGVYARNTKSLQWIKNQMVCYIICKLDW